ncbi:MAG: threonine synthase [Candidatus Fischerbacteria bacterium RBG_13_37_8]|uniref:Threonine synthase n=1 Tax=Candidatus Fischerbacteria bacterium RBG_13_37_8 TaxID=1817863 RepID=A0A1F5VHQ1_9BACT|nr:MAG: threonine synthase [Candidatus Fischerbacteria bacterium RBG_13_37_8]
MNFLTHLECGLCGKILEADKIWNLCPECGKPLLARYDLEAAKKVFKRKLLSTRAPDMWRYRELLPVRDPAYILTLGEGFTPLHHAQRLGKELHFEHLFIKDEGLNPTGSFKARGLSVAVSRAFELGITSVSIPSAGNAAGAMSAYAALAGIEAAVFMPADVPKPFISECKGLGAKVTLINGLITDCGKAAAEELKKFGRFDMSTLKEPYRIEGKKTMGYELAEQMNWQLPDVIIYPTGGGTGLIGMWKAFDEMEQLGWIGVKRPRMVTVQSDGCAPMVKAFHDRKEFAETWQNARTIADGLRVPAAVGDFLILRVLRESNGTAVAISDEIIMEATNHIGRSQGIFACPEGGATLAAFSYLRKEGWIKDNETVVLFNTGSAHKYSHLWE